MYFGINRRRNLIHGTAAARQSSSRRGVELFKKPLLVLIFMPGLFFAAMGVCALIAPQLLIAAISGFFLFLGLVFSLLAWKLIQLKKRFEKVARNFEARVYLEGFDTGCFADDEQGFEQKKVIFH